MRDESVQRLDSLFSIAINLGDDTDTTGVVYGQITGTYYGKEGIPRKWLSILVLRNLIVSLADQLFHINP